MLLSITDILSFRLSSKFALRSVCLDDVALSLRSFFRVRSSILVNS